MDMATGAGSSTEGPTCRGHLCCKARCPLRGEWYPTVILYTVDYLRRGNPIVTPHHFCLAHATGLYVEDIVTDDYWAIVAKKFGSRGPAPPSRAHCRLVFIHAEELLESTVVDLEDT